MNKLIKLSKKTKAILAILVIVGGLFMVGFLGMAHKVSAQEWNDSGWAFDGGDNFSGDMGWVDSGWGSADNTGYVDAYDPCSYGGCDTLDVYQDCSYNCGYDTYDVYNPCDYSCGSYGNYGGSSYGSYGCGSCYSYPNYSYPTYTPTQTYHPPSSTPVTNVNTNANNNFSNSNSTSSSSATATAVNNNTNTIIINTPAGNNNQNQNLTAYCTANPSNPLVGNTVTWQAIASGGNGNYSYSWSGDVYGSGPSVSNTYYNTGTRNANVTVTSDGRQVTANCSVNVQPNGNQAAFTTVYQQPITGTPSAGVFLSQIPATGISMNLKMALFFLGLFMWSAFGAYMIIQKRKVGALAAVGISTSEMGLDSDTEVETPEAEIDTPVQEEVTAEEFENSLSFMARENNVLISRDGLTNIMARTGTDKSAAESMLNTLISKVSRNDGNYATLNSEKIEKLLA